MRLYADELRKKPLDDILEEMKRNINIQFVALPGALGRRASAFDITFRYFDPFKAQQGVRALTTAFESELQRESDMSSGQTLRGSLVVLYPARLPDSPTHPALRMIMMLAGFAIGVLIASFWRIVQRTGSIARQFALVAVVFGIAGLAVVIVADSLDILPYQYRATATLQLRGGGADELSGLAAEAFSRTSLSGVINDPHLRLYQDQLKTMPLEDVVQIMKRHLMVAQPGRDGFSLFYVSFDYPNRYKAQEAVTMIANQLIEADLRQHENGAAAPAAVPMVLDLLDPATLPVSPASPKRYMIAWTGCLCGFVLAGVIALIRRRWKPEADSPVDALQE